ncbi:unnamed protein product, partial [Adineta steineri]
MTTTGPPNPSPLPEKMINPIFPPTSQSTSNGIRPPSFPPNSSTLSAQFPPQINAPIFPPNIQPLSNINNIRINSTSSPSPSP